MSLLDNVSPLKFDEPNLVCTIQRGSCLALYCQSCLCMVNKVQSCIGTLSLPTSYMVTMCRKKQKKERRLLRRGRSRSISLNQTLKHHSRKMWEASRQRKERRRKRHRLSSKKLNMCICCRFVGGVLFQNSGFAVFTSVELNEISAHS